ncbi:MAG: cytochrome P450 [Oscillochloris sp.]|nr:cytochrome P450 [Oscillochloris sp.]
MNHQYDQLRADGPILMQRRGQGSVAYVVGYQAAKQILGDHERFVKDVRNTVPPAQRSPAEPANDMFSLLYNNMLGTDRPDHTRLRALVSRAFTSRHIQALAPRIQAIADQLIAAFATQAEIDLIDAFAFPLPIIVICELLGVPVEDRASFRRWSHAFIGIADQAYAYGQSLTEFVQYISRMIAERRANPRNDLISSLVHAEEQGDRLSEQELFSMIALLIVAGHETTVNLIGNGMAALLQHPDQAALLQREPALIDAAIEEFLRYAGPVEMATMRYAAEDVQIEGIMIRCGTPVVVVLAAANRDPAAFADAAALDITRDARKHVGFGYGVHYCLGAPLARLEAAIAFNTLLARLPGLQLAVPANQLQYNEGTIVRGLIRLPVRWQAPATR